jgi:hypothetical protein
MESVTEFVALLRLLEDSKSCTASREIMRQQQFLFCTYLRDNLDMLTITQLIGGAVLVMLTWTAVFSINLFRFAGKIHKKVPLARRLGLTE